MADPFFFLTQSDRDKLRELIGASDRLLRLARPFQPDSLDVQEQQAPEVYVSKIPTGGLPAAAAGVPGTVESPVYRLNREINESSLEEVPESSRVVHNVSETAIPGDSWVLLFREKYGGWVAVAPTGVGGGGAALTTDQIELSANQDLSLSTFTWQDIGLFRTLGAAGTYFVYGSTTVELEASAVGGANAEMLVGIYNNDTAAFIAGGIATGASVNTANKRVVSQANFGTTVAIAGAHTLRMQYLIFPSTDTFTRARIRGSSTPSYTNLGYMKVG